MSLPNSGHTFRPLRIHELPFRGGSSAAACERLMRIGLLPAALAAGSYLKDRVPRRKPTFVTPPPDSMGP